MSEQQLPSDDLTAAEPTMELLGGDATAATAATAGASLVGRLVRGTVYGVVLLAATALLAVSAVPDLARYASFGAASSGSSCAATSGSACTTLDKVNFESSCEALQSIAATSACCPQASASGAEALLAAGTDQSQAGSCCATLSRASLLAASAGKPACCASSEGCGAADAVAALDEPIDAGSLLAVSTESPNAEQGPDAADDVDQIEE